MSRATDECALLLRRRFGPRVACDVVPLDRGEDELLGEEREAVARAVDSRRREFAAGRACARRLLAGLGVPPAPIPAGPDRAPRWPAGIVGSIAHSEGLCAVAVARRSDAASLGVDTEPDEPLEPALWDTICTPRERRALGALPPAELGRAVRLLFSAKECAYKCIYPLTRRPLEFHDMEIDLQPETASFEARLRDDRDEGLVGSSLQGFYLSAAGSILTGMALPAPARGWQG